MNPTTLAIIFHFALHGTMLRLSDGRRGKIAGGQPERKFILKRNDAGEIVVRIEGTFPSPDNFWIGDGFDSRVPLIPEASNVAIWADRTFKEKEGGPRVVVSEPSSFKYELTEETPENMAAHRQRQFYKAMQAKLSRDKGPQ